jgi:hypothetical protein
MKQKFRDGRAPVSMEPKGGSGAAGRSRFVDRDEAMRYLRTLTHDAADKVKLRNLAGSGSIGKLGTRDLMGKVAGRLAQGAVRAAKFEPETTGASSQGEPPAKKSVFEDPAQLMKKPEGLKLAAPKLPELPKVPDLIPDIDQQIASLLDAAQNAVPFCEQCAKDALEGLF